MIKTITFPILTYFLIISSVWAQNNQVGPLLIYDRTSKPNDQVLIIDGDIGELSGFVAFEEPIYFATINYEENVIYAVTEQSVLSASVESGDIIDKYKCFSLTDSIKTLNQEYNIKQQRFIYPNGVSTTGIASFRELDGAHWKIFVADLGNKTINEKIYKGNIDFVAFTDNDRLVEYDRKSQLLIFRDCISFEPLVTYSLKSIIEAEIPPSQSEQETKDKLTGQEGINVTKNYGISYTSDSVITITYSETYSEISIYGATPVGYAGWSKTCNPISGEIYTTKTTPFTEESLVGLDQNPFSMVSVVGDYRLDIDCKIGAQPTPPEINPPKGLSNKKMAKWNEETAKKSEEYFLNLGEWNKQIKNKENYSTTTVYHKSDMETPILVLDKTYGAEDIIHNKYLMVSSNKMLSLYNLETTELLWSVDIDF